MKPLSDNELRWNEQAATVAATVLSQPIVAATRCEQITEDMRSEGAGVGGVVRGMAKFDRKMMKPMAKVMGMGQVVGMGEEMRTAGLPNTFVLAVTETQIHALEDTQRDGSLVPGKLLKTWDRTGLMATAGAAMGLPVTDRQTLTLFLPMDPGKNKYLRATAAQMTQAGAPGMPTKFLVGKDAASQAVIDALASRETLTAFAATRIEADPALAARVAGATAVTPGATGGNSVEQLERLAQLHATGALSDDEFAAAKAQLIGGA